MSGCERIGAILDAYHDGELGRLRRWSVRRHLGGCAACREELASLDGIGAFVRESLTPSTAPGPDLWSEIRWRLPARPHGSQAGARSGVQKRPLRPAFGMPALGAGVVASALALLVLVGPPDPFGSATGTAMRSLNTHGRPVMVLQGPDDGTIIWLMDEEGVQGAEDSGSVWI